MIQDVEQIGDSIHIHFFFENDGRYATLVLAPDDVVGLLKLLRTDTVLKWLVLQEHKRLLAKEEEDTGDIE